MTRLDQMVEFYAAESPATYVMNDAKFKAQRFAMEMKRAGYRRISYEVLDLYAERMAQECKKLIQHQWKANR